MFFSCSKNIKLTVCLAEVVNRVIKGNNCFGKVKEYFNKILGPKYPVSNFNNVLIIVEIGGEHQFRYGVQIPKNYRKNVFLTMKLRFNLNKDGVEFVKFRFQEAILKAFRDHNYSFHPSDVYWMHTCVIKFQIISKDEDLS